MTKIAIIAGGLGLPALVAQACRRQGKDVFVIALFGFADPSWVAEYPHMWVRLGQAGKLFRLLKEQQCTSVVMVGSLLRPKLLTLFPDWEGFKLFWRLRKNWRGDDNLLRALSRVFEEKSYQVLGADDFLVDYLTPHGVLTKAQPGAKDLANIADALPRLKEQALADKSQAAVIHPDGKIDFEDSSGTDALIKRCTVRGSVLLKIKKPQQDRRLDLPTLGEDTVRQAIASGFSGIAVEAGNSFLLQREQAIALADANRLFIVGIGV